MRFLVVCTLFLGLLVPAQAQSTIPYQRVLLLIAGPSGDRIEPAEQEVITYLNSLRGEYGLYNLQMGTMHFDRDREAAILEQDLGFSAGDGITVGLVRLSDQGVPVETLLKKENVSTASLGASHKSLITRWAQITGEPIPASLRVADTGGPPPISPPVTRPQPRQPVTSNPPQPPRPEPPRQPDLDGPSPRPDVVVTREGITTVISVLHDKSQAVWDQVRNAPLRADLMDVPVREATLLLAQAAGSLRGAHERGLVYPLEEMKEVRAAGRRWRLTEPELYLPVALRQEVKPLLELLDQVETIEYQGRNL